MTKTVLLAAAAVLALTAGASAATHPGVAGAGKGLPPIHLTPLKTLYNQNSNNSGVGLVSQNFSSTFSKTYDASGADDFIVKGKKGWKVREVDVTGVYFNGSGPASSENVTFYKDSGGMPGKVVKAFTNVVGTDNAGSFSIVLPSAAKLKKGHYWVGVVANLNFSTGGEWGWEGNSTINNDPAQWENPGGGFGVGCTTWGPNSTCLGYNQDDMFDLMG